MADDLATGGPTTTPQDAALGALAKDDDASAYISERQAQDQKEQGQLETQNGADRSDKIEAALEEARARSRQAREQEQQLDQDLSEAERAWQQQEQPRANPATTGRQPTLLP
jgi:hypothetical protein